MASDFGTAPSMASRPRQTTRMRALGRLSRLIGEAIETRLDAEREQLFLWLPVALGAGITAWFLLDGWRQWCAFILAALALAAVAATLPAGRRLRRLGIVAGSVAALGCALIWARAEQVAAPRLDRPVVTSFAARVAAIDARPAQGLTRLTLVGAGEGLPPRLRVNVADGDLPAGLVTGHQVRLRARLMPPAEAAVPGAYDFAAVAWFQGIGATGRSLGKVAIVGPARRAGVWPWIMARRAELSAHIRDRLAGAAGGVATSLATGDQGGIPDADADAMRASGLAHLLSISGLHVTAVIAATMLLVLRLLALSPRLALNAPLPLIAAGAGALAGIAYTLLAGAEVPTVRSCVAALLVLIGIALGRDAITLRLVAAGALVILLLWPESLAGASFQLSFAAVTAIIALNEQPRVKALLGRREEGAAARGARAFATLLLSGIAVEAALAPIGLFHFHRAGLYGALANIVAIPLTTVIIMPLEAGALLLDLAGLGGPLWWLAGHAIGLLLWIAHIVAAAPGAVAALPSMPRGAFALMVAGGLWIALWRTGWRRAGVVPLAAGALWALLAPAPDLLVTGDGRHVAVRAGDGTLALLRPRAGDYVRDMLGEAAGFQGEAAAFDTLPGARCGPDLCRLVLSSGGRRWTVLATRSTYLVDITAMNRACAAADIVISDRRLPRSCRPRWLKADRPWLAQQGGVAIHLASGRVRTVAEGRRGKPWAK